MVRAVLAKRIVSLQIDRGDSYMISQWYNGKLICKNEGCYIIGSSENATMEEYEEYQTQMKHNEPDAVLNASYAETIDPYNGKPECVVTVNVTKQSLSLN